MLDAYNVFSNLSDRGSKLQEALQKVSNRSYKTKELATFNLERAAKMAGCSQNHIRKLEELKEIPPAQFADLGRRKVRSYSLAAINEIREKTGNLPRRPQGSKAAKVVFQNLKGGVAKSVTALHFAQFLALKGYRVLIIDSDPQATTTSAFGYVPDLNLTSDDTLYPALIEDSKLIKNSIKKTYWDGLDLIPSQLALQDAAFMLPNPEQSNIKKLGDPAFRLSKAIKTIEDDYDVIVVDTSPALSMLSINTILVEGCYMICPLPPQMFDLSSSAQFFSIMRDIAELKKPQIRQFNILITRHDSSPDALDMTDHIRRAYGDYLLTNYMSQTQELTKGSNDLLSVYEIDKKTQRGAKETYRRAIVLLDAVNTEILDRINLMWQEDIKEKGGPGDD